jgi:hypothetical protein
MRLHRPPAGGHMTPFDRASLSLSGSELPSPTVGGSPLTSPEFVNRLAAAIAEARGAGLLFARSIPMDWPSTLPGLAHPARHTL